MTVKRPNRWNAARDLHDAALRNPPRKPRKSYTLPTWSLPLPRVLRWMGAAVLLAFAFFMFRSALVDLLRGVL